MALRLITAPAAEPLSLDEVKEHLRYDDADQDALIALFITAARSHVDGKDGYLGRALVTQTWELVLDQFPDAIDVPTGEIVIPLPPLQEIVSIKYDDANGEEQTISAALYRVDTASEPARVRPGTAGWPTPIDHLGAIRVRFTCGYTSSGDSPDNLTASIPGAIKAALLLTIGSMFEHREEVIVGSIAVKLPFGAEALLRPFRVLFGMA